MDFRVKRVYEKIGEDDGDRILVDRLWPRGVSKEKAGIDLWMKEVAPSAELRKEYHGDTVRWEEFAARYAGELDAAPERWTPLIERARHGRVTLLFAARDPERNNAVALLRYLESKAG